MYTSQHVTQFFSISRETVRRWVDEFRDFLSPTATPEQGRQRMFTDEDLRVLALVADFKRRGGRLDDAKAALAAGQRGELPTTLHTVVHGERNRLAELQQQVSELRAALNDSLNENQRALGQVELLTRQLEAAQSEIRALNREIGRLERDTD